MRAVQRADGLEIPSIGNNWQSQNTLPSLELKTSPAVERQAMRAMGTDNREGATPQDNPPTQIAPKIVKRGQSVSLAVVESGIASERTSPMAISAPPEIQAKKHCPLCLRTRLFDWRHGDRILNLRLTEHGHRFRRGRQSESRRQQVSGGIRSRVRWLGPVGGESRCRNQAGR